MRRVSISTERHEGAPDELWQGDALALMPRLIEAHGGRAQLAYIDPPFLTGKRFEHRRETPSGAARIAAYDDRWADRDYYAFLRAAIEGLCGLLARDGSLFVHIDYRTSARVRLLLDELLGEDAFVNEIIWSYESGGRATRHFSRKHDTILYYRMSPDAPFFPDAVGMPRERARANHMRRGVDEDGRAYRSIRSGGKEYRYYDDDTVPPGDVWDDISHLQQRDPERTGYETQKPLRLLDRIVRCATRPGDLVVDAFCGSGTTLDAARRAGRRFVGVDVGDAAVAVCRERLCAGGLVVRHEGGIGGDGASACGVVGGDALPFDAHVERDGESLTVSLRMDAGIPAQEAPWGWSMGVREGDTYRVAARSLGPKWVDALSMAVPGEGAPCVQIISHRGVSSFFDV